MLRILFISAFMAFTLPLAFNQPAFAQDEDDEEAEQAAPQSNLFAEFDPISVAVIRDRRIQGHLGISFYLAVSSIQELEEVERQRARIVDSLVQYLARVAAARINPKRPLDLNLISSYMQQAIDDIMGENMATVLIQTASVTPAR